MTKSIFKYDWAYAAIISEYEKLPLSVINKNKKYLNWVAITRNHEITIEFVDKFNKWIIWKILFMRIYTDDTIEDKYKILLKYNKKLIRCY